MRAGDGEFHPLGDIGRVVADTLQILGDHQDIEHALALLRIFGNIRDQVLLALCEQVVNHVVVFYHAPRQRQVAAHERIQAVRHHFDGGLRHLLDMLVMAARTGQVGDDFGDIARLVADALDIRDHFQYRGDQAQVACHRLLLQQELEAHGFNLALLAVDLLVNADGGGGELGVARQQRLDRAGNRVLAQCPHGDQLVVQFDELCVETVSHQPNLPVM